MMGFWNRARSRGLRPEIPAVAPGTNIFPGSGQWGEVALPLPPTTAVLGLPAASRARNLISNAVAQMAPMELWTPDGYKADYAPQILTRPNSVYGCFDWFQMVLNIVIMHGTFCGIKADFDKDGYAQQIVPVPPGLFLARYDRAGYLVVDILGETYSREEVVLVRANCAPNQPMGIGVVHQFRRSIGMALDQQNFAASTYRSGSIPAGIIRLDLPEIDPIQATAVQAQWLSSHSSGARAPAVLPKTMSFEPLQWSPEDMQFLQARQFTTGEIAHMFNLDPSDLGAALAGSSMTYANIEQRQQVRIVDSYAPWMRRLEEEWSDLVPGQYVAKLQPENLSRTDTKTRAEVDGLQIANKTLTPDEARHRDGKRPLPKEMPTVGAPEGDKPLPAEGE
jgi:HK97 family phage portal protein